MKILKDRQEIALAINGHKMPVVTIDLADSDRYGLKSKPVLIDNGKFENDGMPYYIKAKIRVYSDNNKKFVFSAEPVCISNDFGYDKIEEMLTFRNAPIIKTDEDVMIVVIDSIHKLAYAPMVLHSGKRISPFCSEPLSFVDSDYKIDDF